VKRKIAWATTMIIAILSRPGWLRPPVGKTSDKIVEKCATEPAPISRKGPVMFLFLAATSLPVLAAAPVLGQNVNFETDTVGTAPKDWILTMTGRGNPRWTVEQDDTAPSQGRVLKQSGTATYPLALKEGTRFTDGFVEARIKPIAGSEDRAGGLVWRARDANNYYVVRANALEDNVVLYKTVNGKRSPLDIVGRKGGYGVKVAVPSGQWHTLRVEVSGQRFRVVFNGQPLFDVEDGSFSGPGMVGLWTKADSITAFDDFTYGAP
jgi:hypothetical protein